MGNARDAIRPYAQDFIITTRTDPVMPRDDRKEKIGRIEMERKCKCFIFGSWVTERRKVGNLDVAALGWTAKPLGEGPRDTKNEAVPVVEKKARARKEQQFTWRCDME